MGIQSFIIILSVCGSFFYAAARVDVETLLETLDDIKDQEVSETEDLGTNAATNTGDDNHILRELADMTDMLERTTANDEELSATNNRDREATDWEDGTMLDTQAMLADLDAVAEDVQQDQHQIMYQKVGCYQDNQVDPRPLPELLADLTGEVDWHQLDKVIQKCAKLAYDKGYTHFGMQSFGQCRSGKNASSTYNRDGIVFGGCGSGSGLGGHGENLVFMVVSLQLTTPSPTAKPTTIPSECQNYVTLNSINRSMNFNESVSSCDDILPRGWYRFEGPAGNKMPTSCVPIRHCGGHAPGWLTGAHPAVHEGMVKREVCFHWKSCCSWSNSVLVRNCGAFFVYYLSPPLSCNLRYCGDGQEPVTTSPFKSTVTTTEAETTKVASPTTTPTPALTTETTTTAPETTTVASTTEKSTPPELTTPSPTAKPTTIPSECQNYVTLNSINRSMNFNESVSSCDDKLPRGWYRFEGPAGNKMPTSCVPIRHCGGHAPGWLTGAHPAVHEGMVKREVCFHWKSCCSWSNSVLVRNCGAFFVYYLSPPLSCNLRYCGDGQEPVTTSPFKSTVTTTEAETTKVASPTTTPTPALTTETTTTAPETTTVASTTEKSTPPVPSTVPSIPSECVNYSNLDSADRSMHFKVRKHLAKCDSSLQMGWYRFQGDAGDHIPTSCVVKEHCGTHAPGWLSGAHPTVSQGALRAKVCFHWVEDCCKWSTYIRVRNCSGFYVYELNRPPVCRLRYCGNGVQAPTTSPTSPPTSSSTHGSTTSSTSSHSTTSPTSPATPPECLKYKLLKESNRAQGYSSKNQHAACDRALSSDWYRFSGEAGDKMPDFCVAKLRCGTHAPGWLNTTHPSVADGIVNATVCFHWGSNCCYWSTEIGVRNCGGFFVYELHRTTHCSLRYCGNNREVPTLTTITTSAPTTLISANECSEYKELSEEGRSQNYKYRSVQGAKPTCDRWLPKAWYRFSGLAGDRMPDKCVPTYRCGTLAPGWLQGGHPSVRDGLVSRTVCFNWGQTCCRWRRNISVRNCGDFYVYKLQEAPVCKLRYCGVGQIAQTTMPKPTTTGKPTTPKPTTSPPFPTEPNYGFVIVCLPFGMHVHVSRQRLPSFVNPSLLSLDDPRCGVVKMDDNDVMLATTLDSCGTMRRTEDDRISFHNKIVAESGLGNKRSSFEFPFRCTYKKFSSVGQVNKFEPLNKRGQVMDSTFDYE